MCIQKHPRVTTQVEAPSDFTALINQIKRPTCTNITYTYIHVYNYVDLDVHVHVHVQVKISVSTCLTV